MRERVDSPEGPGWLEEVARGMWLVFASPLGEHAAGVVVEEEDDRYTWLAWGMERGTMPVEQTKIAAVTAVLARAR